MSWLFSQSGPVKQVKDAFKAAAEANPLNEPEKSLRHEGEAALAKIESILGRDFPVNFSGYGSQTTVDGKVVSVSVNLSIT